jgi:N-acetylmuramoyl-L-alanine amidase
MRLARHLRQSLAAAGIETSGIYQAALPALGRGNLPTVLVELGYLTNTEDHTRLVTDAGRETIAQALFDGLQNFIRKTEETAP